MDRRTFLRAGAGAGALAELAALAGLAGHSAGAHAQAADEYRALVCVFLGGGNDGNNLLVPTDAGSYATYARGRGGLALPSAQLLPITPSNAAGRPFGLHPAIADIQRLFAEGKAALVANVGTLLAPTTKAQWRANSVPLPDNLFSHSDQQAQWQSAMSEGGGRTGWAGRIGDALQSLNTNRGATCISLSGNTLWEVGASTTAYKVSPGGTSGFGFYDPSKNTGLSAAVKSMLAVKREHVLQQAWLSTIERSIETQRVLSGALASSNVTVTFPGGDLGNQLKMAARLIAARGTLGMRRQTFFCQIGGFDLHGDEALPKQQQLLGEVSRGLAAFHAAMVQIGVADKVTAFTASDFGRNLPSNGQGSDHGWGNHHLVVGGAVRGGALYGKFPDLAIEVPSTISPQLMSMSSSCARHSAVLVASLSDGAGLQP
jgi:uncharacterized protein (DUF1501 family)